MNNNGSKILTMSSKGKSPVQVFDLDEAMMNLNTVMEQIKEKHNIQKMLMWVIDDKGESVSLVSGNVQIQDFVKIAMEAYTNAILAIKEGGVFYE